MICYRSTASVTWLRKGKDGKRTQVSGRWAQVQGTGPSGRCTWTHKHSQTQTTKINIQWQPGANSACYTPYYTDKWGPGFLLIICPYVLALLYYITSKQQLSSLVISVHNPTTTLQHGHRAGQTECAVPIMNVTKSWRNLTSAIWSLNHLKQPELELPAEAYHLMVISNVSGSMAGHYFFLFIHSFSFFLSASPDTFIGCYEN